MRPLLYALSFLAVMALGFWAYRENYATQQVLSETQRLQREIGSAKLRLSVLRAEWAYLNRPDRLMELSEINYDRLGLLPMAPEQFGSAAQIVFPPPPLSPSLDITGAQSVAGVLNADPEEASTP